MSKSLGNVILAKHFYEKYGANVFRYLILNTHYNQVINLSEELIQQATDYTQKIKNLLKKLNFYLYTEQIKITEQEAPKGEEIITSLLNNLNTVKVLFFLEQTINSLNKIIDQRERERFKFALPTYNLEVKLLIKNWQDLRSKGNYKQADQIRKQLQALDIL
ncbi:7378_t:CDS:2 [Entrophospora sp. SA101]|nr:2545_t:CDS:2 [Entrophospora sp. SA101]CAJ0888717.1 7378_t:CDS:2 [Entrophospora sp. SA101]